LGLDAVWSAATELREETCMSSNALNPSAADMAATPRPTFAEALAVWLRIGLLSFGGPAGQIALMHKVLVEERRWIDEQRFLSALNFCMLLPGPEAMQLATYVGWRLHGVKGGLAAGLLFVLPGALVVLALSAFYAAFGKVPMVEALFLGVKAAVLAIVVEALMRVAKRALKGSLDWFIALAAFAGIFFLNVPFPIIVIAAGLVGYMRVARPAIPADAVPPVPVHLSMTLKTAAVWLAIWLLPLAALVLVFGRGHVLAELGWFFSKLAVVTFGGAYAVLAYMAQDVVEHYRWLTPGEMMDALGLAETTPGPLILVTEFVGFLAAHRHGGEALGLGPWGMGILGALVTLWATFAPCFLWIFAGAPYVERLNAEPRLKAALAAITAAVVGVILNLTVWFALNVLFAKVDVVTSGPFRLHIPAWQALSLPALGLAALAFLMLLVWHRGVMTTLAVCAALAVALRFAMA
jgi:chromate transporter